MKKFLILALLAISTMVFSQTGTLVDMDSYIQVNYSSGDTVCIGKSNVVYLKVVSNEVYVMGSNQWGKGAIVQIISLNPTQFGYTATELRNYLAAAIYKTYTTTYHYTDGNVDTVSYYVGDTLQFKTAFTYTAGAVTEKTAPFKD